MGCEKLCGACTDGYLLRRDVLYVNVCVFASRRCAGGRVLLVSVHMCRGFLAMNFVCLLKNSYSCDGLKSEPISELLTLPYSR